MKSHLEIRRQEQRLLAEEHSLQEAEEARTSSLSDLLLSPFGESAMLKRSYEEIDLSPLLRKAG